MNGSNSAGVGLLILGLVVFAVLVVLYFLPAIIASNRNHSNGGSIFILNLFLGWTFLGWIGALVWAFSDNTRERGTVSNDRASAPLIWGVVAILTAIPIIAFVLWTDKAPRAAIIQEVPPLAAPASQVPQKESLTSAIHSDVEGFTQSRVDPEYQTYTNGRYGFRVDCPESFRADRAPENGDGLTLKSEDGKATLVVWGMNDDGFTLKEEFDRAVKNVQGQLGFNKMGGSWFVVTWTDGENLGYTKEFVGAHSQNSFTITFPVDQRSQYDGIVTKIEKSFKPGDLDSSH